MSKTAWNDVVSRISAISLLREGWDSYGAVAPDPDAIAGAKKLAVMLEAKGFSVPDTVTASSNGTVYFEWHITEPDGYREIEVESLTAAEMRWVGKGEKKADVSRIEIA